MGFAKDLGARAAGTSSCADAARGAPDFQRNGKDRTLEPRRFQSGKGCRETLPWKVLLSFGVYYAERR